MVVFIRTNKFSKTEPSYSGSTIVNFGMPTNDTCKLIPAAKEGLAKIYDAKYKYKKAGIILLNLVVEEVGQQNFFVNTLSEEKSAILMATIDKINTTMRKEAVFVASEGITRAWQVKADMRSNRFTTNWKELLFVS